MVTFYSPTCCTHIHHLHVIVLYGTHTGTDTHVYLQCVTWDSRTGPLRWAISDTCKVTAWEAQCGVGCAGSAVWSLEAVESPGTMEWRCRRVEAPRGALMCWGRCTRWCVGCVCSKCWAAGRGGEAYMLTTMERSEGRDNTKQWLLGFYIYQVKMHAQKNNHASSVAHL